MLTGHVITAKPPSPPFVSQLMPPYIPASGETLHRKRCTKAFWVRERKKNERKEEKKDEMCKRCASRTEADTNALNFGKCERQKYAACVSFVHIPEEERRGKNEKKKMDK